MSEATTRLPQGAYLQHVPASAVEAARPAAAVLNIIGINLAELEYKTRELREGFPSVNTLTTGTRFARTDDDENTAVVIGVRFDYGLAYEQGSDEEPPVSISATFSVLCVGDRIDDLTDEQVEAFARVNGPHLTWSYARELIDSTLRRAGLLHGVLPVFHRVVEK